MPIDDILAADPTTTYEGQASQAQQSQSSTNDSSSGTSTQVTIDLGKLTESDVRLLLEVVQAAALVYIAWKL
jgi:hypothetical protein